MRVGSLCTGYAGLDLAVGGTVEWYSEIDPSASLILSNAFPFVPNLGDLTTIDWHQVEPVDVITAGYPCQPFSIAGLRKGTDDDRHLWPYIADAISVVRPRIVVLENVAGHRTMGLDVVLSDLARMGFSARWGTVRASDAGAPHQRARLFIVAHTPDTDADGYGSRPGPGRMGTLDRGTESPTPQRQRARRQSGTGSPRDWRHYAPAIARWERILGRPAPDPVLTAEVKGGPRLNPAFVEWMMGLPEGWVTGHGLTRPQALRTLGNGVVPQQARLALDLLGAPL